MNSFEIFMIPGQFVLGMVLRFLQVSPESFEPVLFTVFAAIVSWIIWVMIFRAAWEITLKVLGFRQQGRYR